MADQRGRVDRLDDLIVEFREFREQYEVDMRGDKSLNNGNSGVIGELRRLKERFEKYPSITWMFATKPFRTVGTILAIYMLLNALYTLGLIRFLSAFFGVPIP